MVDIPDYWTLDGRDVWGTQEELDHVATTGPKRTLWFSQAVRLDADREDVAEIHAPGCKWDGEARPYGACGCGAVDSTDAIPVDAGHANLISSLTTNGMHAPALDIDFEARLIPSRTKGHYHLYLETEMPWWKYRALLKVLAWCGIIEPGYYRASVRRRKTMLRWNLWDWETDGGPDSMAVAELLQIREYTSTVQPTEPKELP